MLMVLLLLLSVVAGTFGRAVQGREHNGAGFGIHGFFFFL